ncbi:MAG: hypothetical protein JRG76_12895 [Deltaproteobacteria bacterium]|nr:hypothetical protein [Deltaproteobacteria bacterium]MBW2415397.1 hypothetical protein [Deltaproteobacteria bacterium]
MHPIGNAACSGIATPGGVWFESGRLDAVVHWPGGWLRTSYADRMDVGLGWARRCVFGEGLSLEHLVFAPAEPRPLLLGLAAIRNSTAKPVVVDYCEIWDVTGSDPSSAPGACIRETGAGRRALADAGIAIRARAPDPAPQTGLALDLRLPLPAHTTRELSFAYAAPGPNEDPAALVQGWRGQVHAALDSMVSGWLERLADAPDPLAAYRNAIA